MHNYISSLCSQFSTRVGPISSSERINDQRRVSYILYTHTLTLLGVIFFFPLHLFVYHKYAAALVDIIWIIICSLILIDFWIRGNLLHTAWFSTLAPSGLAICLFWLMRGENQIGNYLMIPPIFAFLMLGRKHGIIFSGGYVAVIAGLTIFYFDTWSDFIDGSFSVINFWGAMVLSLFWCYSGEQVRNQSFESIETIADADPLTDAVNRRRFFEQLAVAQLQIKYNGRSSAFLMLDIDHFKNINDSYGHEMGDKVLIELVKLLKQSVRTTDVVGRIGGEEFGIIFHDITEQSLIDKAEVIRKSIEQHAFKTNNKIVVPVTVSIGLALFSHQQEVGTALIYKQADEQLYRAKQAGRNRVAIQSMERV